MKSSSTTIDNIPGELVIGDAVQSFAVLLSHVPVVRPPQLSSMFARYG